MILASNEMGQAMCVQHKYNVCLSVCRCKRNVRDDVDNVAPHAPLKPPLMYLFVTESLHGADEGLSIQTTISTLSLLEERPQWNIILNLK